MFNILFHKLPSILPPLSLNRVEFSCAPLQLIVDVSFTYLYFTDMLNNCIFINYWSLQWDEKRSYICKACGFQLTIKHFLTECQSMKMLRRNAPFPWSIKLLTGLKSWKQLYGIMHILVMYINWIAQSSRKSKLLLKIVKFFLYFY